MGEVFGSLSLICCRRPATCRESSSVRAGASPRQKGTVGGARGHLPPARVPICLRPGEFSRNCCQQHNVARVALNGEVFIECADDHSFRLGNHGKQRSFRNGAAAGDCRQPRSTPRAQFAIDAIAMDVSAIAPSPRRNASESISRIAS